MILTRNNLQFFLREDAKRNNIKSNVYYYLGLVAGLENCHAYRYLKCLRKLEYHINKKHSVSFIRLFYRFRLYRLGFRYHIQIQPNVVGYGFRILHISGGGGVVINAKRLGNYCGCNSGVLIGNLGSQDKRPVIGDYVAFQMGAKVYGEISIGDNCIIAPNTVVYKDVPNDTVVSGVPAQVISSNCKNRDNIICSMNKFS